MTAQQERLALLQDPVAQELLQSSQPARLAYNWFDGTPRVVPIWFFWTGEQIVVAGPPDAPKVEALREHPDVAITIDDASEWPYRALLIRGRATVEITNGVCDEYARAAERYLGEEQGQNWAQMVGQMISEMNRIKIQPNWVEIIDFQTRFPSALAKRMH